MSQSDFRSEVKDKRVFYVGGPRSQGRGGSRVSAELEELCLEVKFADFKP